jgi:hypothetical protein
VVFAVSRTPFLSYTQPKRASQARLTQTHRAHRAGERRINMAQNPKDNEQKIRRMLNGWQTLAPNKSFGGMTLAQFQAAAQPSLDTRDNIDTLEDQLKQEQANRDSADEVSLAKAQQVVNGVLADPTEGPDSALYESFGYTPKRDRASGLTRKSKKTGIK